MPELSGPQRSALQRPKDQQFNSILEGRVMKRWILTGGIVALLVTVLLTTFTFSGTDPVSTEDIDAIYDHNNQTLDAASFVPDVSKEVVIGKSIHDVGKALIGKDTSKLKTRATVGLYTGPDNRGNPMEGRRVWLEVVYNLPLTFPSGPYKSPENRVDGSNQRQQNQLVVFYDAETGEEIWGAVTGRLVDEVKP